jgi:capsular exopolysaccharide synthesis family protein
MRFARYCMSRVYRALEKAEKEKRLEVKEETPLRILRERETPKREESVVKFPQEKVERLELPPREELSVLMPPINSYAAEEFRKLKTQVFGRFPNPPCSLLITSAAPEEGKTTVSVNLAFAISREFQKKAILIDGDLRNPSIHPENGSNGKGLSSYLSGQGSFEEILQQSETENLRIIPAGPSSSRSTELIGSRRMGELLTSLRKQEGEAYIIIDSSPVISTSEPITLSKMVDGVILVIMAGKTPKESIKRAFKSIDQQKVVGVVFNQIDMKQSAYYSKYYYKYSRK